MRGLEDIVLVEINLHRFTVRFGSQDGLKSMEREVGGPGNEVGLDDRRSVEGVVPIVRCSFPFTNVSLWGPSADSL